MSLAEPESTDESRPVPDASGTATFARYRWQAKMAVFVWLACRRPDTDALGVLCEDVEDLVVIHSSRRVFAQLKTRDRGSWSVSKICADGGGIDSLVRAHSIVRPCRDGDSFELWLEGPSAEDPETRAFFDDPTSAKSPRRTRLVALGMKRAHLPDFLARLTIVPQRPPRPYIDAVVQKTIGALWPALSGLEQDELYERLLQCAEKAQAGELEPHAAETLLDSAGYQVGHARRNEMSERCLTREHLCDITPPIPEDSREEILARLGRGIVTSALELKMQAGGASVDSIDRALALRARAERRRMEILAASPDRATEVSAVEESLVSIGNATVGLASMLSSGTPSIGARPAEWVAANIQSQAANLMATDAKQLFGQPDLLYGLLCQVSDECRFWWRT